MNIVIYLSTLIRRYRHYCRLPHDHFSLVELFLTVKISMQSDNEKEMVVRTVYCTNIDRKVD